MNNKDASCQNCTFYTNRGACKQANNMLIDYSRVSNPKLDNPYCWHWERKTKLFENIKVGWRNGKK